MNTGNKMNFPNADSLKHVQKVVNDAAAAVNDPKRTISDSPLSNTLTGVIGAGVGGAVSFAGLYTLGLTGLSAAGITSALAAAGSIVGGGMAAGVVAFAAPVVGLAAAGAAIGKRVNDSRLEREKRELLTAVIARAAAVRRAMRNHPLMSAARRNYLHGLVLLLEAAERDLRADLRRNAA